MKIFYDNVSSNVKMSNLMCILLTKNLTREDKKRMQNVVKILLLGCGEAGKVGFMFRFLKPHREGAK